MDSDFMYKLKVGKEDRKKGGEGWYRLRWRPIKNGTYNLFISRNWRGRRSVGFNISETGTHNGWRRGWDGIRIEIDLFFFTICFWVIFNIMVHKDGPSDGAVKRPLGLPKLRVPPN